MFFTNLGITFGRVYQGAIFIHDLVHGGPVTHQESGFLG
jgi:hypothetical protein